MLSSRRKYLDIFNIEHIMVHEETTIITVFIYVI